MSSDGAGFEVEDEQNCRGRKTLKEKNLERYKRKKRFDDCLKVINDILELQQKETKQFLLFLCKSKSKLFF